MGKEKNMTDWYRFKEDLNVAPTTEGVYLLGNSLKKPIYVGRADNLQERLSQHPDPDNPCLQRKEIKYFAFEETSNSEEREQELIEEYDPECNRTQ
ncbi:UvrABC system protein C [subsurface metagenome]